MTAGSGSEETQEETKFGITGADGETVEVSEDDMMIRLNDLVNVKDVTVSVGETRQLREYQPNNYHVSFKTEVGGVAALIASVAEEGRKACKKLFLSLLTAKMAGQVASMKRFIHAEMVKDGFDKNTIDWRKGEKEKVLGSDS